MQFFQKKLFLQKIKELMPELKSVQSKMCKYTSYRFTEWLSFEYGNFCYIFHHAQYCGAEVLNYGKRRFDAIMGETTGPLEVRKLSIAS